VFPRKELLIKIGVLAAVAVLSFAILLSVIAYKTPVYSSKSYGLLYIEQRVEPRYSFGVKPSMIYDYREVLGPHDPVYKALLRTVNLTLRYRVVVRGGKPSIRGVYRPFLAINSSSGWSKTLWLGPPAVFNRSQIDMVLNLNVTWARELVASIDKELGVRAASTTIGFGFAISSDVKVHGKVHRISARPQLLLSYGSEGARLGVVFIDGVPEPYVESRTVVHENRLSLALFTLPVSRARVLGPALAAVSLAPILFAFLRGSEKGFHEAIAKKYGSILVDGHVKVDKGIEVRIESVEKLMELANRIHRPVVHSVSSSGDGGVVHSYLLVDGDTVYIYSHSEEPPSSVRENSAAEQRSPT